ncbi:MAG: MFS transporter [Phycisphaeraceae bacterium]|nr:MAG: MFS transporter [Phycisphaeraceae bacterium]
MATTQTTDLGANEVRASWVPMIVIGMAQALMSFNVAAIPVSMAGMVKSFDTPPTTVGTAIVMYSLGVSGFVMLGAKLGQRYGAKRIFQIVIAMFGASVAVVALSPTAMIMVMAQATCGLAAAALVPSLVALIANHYSGKQQAEAVGWLGSARAIAGVLAFLIVGSVATFISWRLAFGLLVIHCLAILFLSTRLKASEQRLDLKIDVVGVVLAAAGIMLMTFGFNNVRGWGLTLASPAAPFDLVGVSPAPLMIVGGVLIVAAFFRWSHRRAAAGKPPLLALEVIDSHREWAAVIALFLIVSMEAAINFTVPLYIQIVQGRSAFQTSIAMMPFLVTVFFTAILIVRLYNRFTPRQIARGGFSLVLVGTLWLAFVVTNDWSTFPVMLGLVVVGLGQGALVTLLFNVLVTAAPKEAAGDVGSLRGVTQNLAAAVGTAMAGALLVGVLSAVVLSNLSRATAITPELQAQLNLNNINFVSNDRLYSVLEGAYATHEEVEEAVRINTEARLRALRVGFLVMSGLSLIAFIPSGWLPGYKPGQIPPNPHPDEDPAHLMELAGEDA